MRPGLGLLNFVSTSAAEREGAENDEQFKAERRKCSPERGREAARMEQSPQRRRGVGG